MRKNEEITLDIVDNGINLEGVAKIQQHTVFIQGAIQGEKVKAHMMKVGKNYSFAKVVEVVQPCRDRVKPACKVASSCGGCQGMHLSYDKELCMKEKNALATLKKFGISTYSYQGIYGMGKYEYYRNKVSYPIRQHNGKNKIGFYANNSHFIVENEVCHIQQQEIDHLAKKVFNQLLELKFSCYNEEMKIGDIKHLILRRGHHSHQIMVTIVVTDKKLLADQRFLKLVSLNENITSVNTNLNKEITNEILGQETVCIYGKEYIVDDIGDYCFCITPKSFFQVNTIQTEILYEKLKEGLQLTKQDVLFDLYSGVGTIGIFLSNQVSFVYGIEIEPTAVKMANLNLSLNHVTNAQYIAGSVQDKIVEFKQSEIKPTVIVVDPPRKGLDEQSIQYILEFCPEKIGYVSCNVATLARDLNLLSKQYKVTSVTLVDMFPRTSHVECVVVLGRKENLES